jgi:hypothetical protein
MYELTYPPPLVTFEGGLRQINSNSLNADGLMMLRLCAPYFYPLGEDERDAALADMTGWPVSMTHLQFSARQFRRWSGDSMSPGAGLQLPRERYFSLCLPNSIADGGVLAEEMNAYRHPRSDLGIRFWDLMNPEVASQLGMEPMAYIGLFIDDARPLMTHLDEMTPVLADAVSELARAGEPFMMALGTMHSNAKIGGVLDLRRKDAQAWFFETFVKTSFIPTAAERFEDILPDLINQALGGASLDDGDVRLLAIGAFFRRIGIYGLVSPSARSDCMVAYRDGEPVDWLGWNLILYGDAQPVETAFVDLGGWKAALPPTVTFREFGDAGQNLSGWAIDGVRALNHAMHVIRHRNSSPGIPSVGPMAFNALEIVEECEESFANAARAWYNFDGGETVWFPPYRQYMLLNDLREGRVPVFHPGPAPYLIEHETHTRFRCMFCDRDMANLLDYSADRAFFTKTGNLPGSYERRVWRCKCRWWMVEMGCTAHADDDNAWSLNETIYVQGALRHFDTTCLQAVLEAFVADLAERETHFTSVTDLLDKLQQSLVEGLGCTSLRIVAPTDDRDVTLLLAATSDGPKLLQLKLSSDAETSGSLAAIRTLNGVRYKDGEVFGVVVTTGPVLPIMTVGGHRAIYRGTGFFRHTVRLTNVDELLEGLELSREDSLVAADHFAFETFEAWQQAVNYRPYGRFRRLIMQRE